MNKLLLITFFLILGCQKEEDILTEDITQNIRPTLPLHGFLERITQNNTSVDNVLDGTSAIKVKLPVQITLNNIALTINTANDYILVENIKNQSASDDDIVNYQFPIVVELRNYQEINISNNLQLNNVISNNRNVSELSCAAIQYPISVNLYNASNQIASNQTFNSRIQLINFLITANNDLIYQLKYPINVTNASGATQTVNNNQQLQNLIENAIVICGNNAGNFEEFVDIITNGTWVVEYLFEDSENQTTEFEGYQFTFLPNGNIVVLKNGTSYDGSWEYFEDSGNYKFKIEFDDDDFDDMEEDWIIIEFSNNKIYLKDDNHFLTFSKL